MKILVIYNPKAGGGRARKLLSSITNGLETAGIEADVMLTERRGHGIELAANADLSKYDAVVASGGDGTLFEVVNGYFQNKGKKKPPIGLIPNGTGNAFMKELNLVKSDWQKAIDIIKKNQPKALDIGRFECEGFNRYFINIVGMGFVSRVAQAAESFKWMGNTAYTIATLLKMVKLKPQKIEIELDNEVLYRDGIFVEVANTRYTGTSFVMAPKAKVDDGLLDVVLLNKISRFRLLLLFTSIYDGTHINYHEVEYFQAKKIKVIEQYPEALIPDGEILGSSPVEFECLAGAVQFLWD